MQLREGRLYIRHDHVILEMIRGLNGQAIEVEAPFDPERGAFAHEHARISPEAPGRENVDHH
jgi:urease accessory protein